MHMKSTVVQVGDELAVIIPKKIAKRLGWKAGTLVDMAYDEATEKITVWEVTEEAAEAGKITGVE